MLAHFGNHSNTYFVDPGLYDFFFLFFFHCSQIDSSVSTNTSHPVFTAVFATFTTLITDTALPLNLKVVSFLKSFQTVHLRARM